MKNWSEYTEEQICPGYTSVDSGSDIEPQATQWMSSLAEVIGEDFKEDIKLLDFGCGHARFANFMSGHLKSFNYWGFDVRIPEGEKGIINAIENLKDPRVKVSFIAEAPQLFQEAVENANVGLVASLFMHVPFATFCETIEMLTPIIDRGGKIVYDLFTTEAATYHQEQIYYGVEYYRDCKYNMSDVKEFLSSKKLKSDYVLNYSHDDIFIHEIYNLRRK